MVFTCIPPNLRRFWLLVLYRYLRFVGGLAVKSEKRSLLLTI